MFFKKLFKFIFILLILVVLFLLGHAFNLDTYSFDWGKLVLVKQRLQSYFPEKEVKQESEEVKMYRVMFEEEKQKQKPLKIFLGIEGLDTEQDHYELTNLAIYDAYDSMRVAG